MCLKNHKNKDLLSGSGQVDPLKEPDVGSTEDRNLRVEPEQVRILQTERLPRRECNGVLARFWRDLQNPWPPSPAK